MSTEADSQPAEDAELANRFLALLDQHGYGFQYAVIRKLHELFRQYERWLFEVAEFPTTTGRFDTRIDFIIRLQRTRFFLVAECKRANPALNDWCFVRAAYVRRNRSYEKLFIEEIIAEFAADNPDRPERVSSHGKDLDYIVDRVYHIGFEVKNSRNKGDSSGGSGRKTIEEAAGQVCKGVNGLATTLAQMSQNTLSATRCDRVVTHLMPAIFTTAKLWVSDSDLGDADLLTGNMAPDSVTLHKVPWLFLQYPVSPGLKHSLPTSPLGYEFSDMLDLHYMRTIAVVSSQGIEDFIQGFYPYPSEYP